MTQLFPIIKHFKSNNIYNAFLLASILQTIMLSFTLATKDKVDKIKVDPFINFLISILYIFIITMCSFIAMFIIFGYGGGMIID